MGRAAWKVIHHRSLSITALEPASGCTPHPTPHCSDPDLCGSFWEVRSLPAQEGSWMAGLKEIPVGPGPSRSWLTTCHPTPGGIPKP